MQGIIKIRSKYNGVCAETGKTIAKGEQIAYCTRRKKAFHKTAKRFKNADKINDLRHKQELGMFFNEQQSARNKAVRLNSNHY